MAAGSLIRLTSRAVLDPADAEAALRPRDGVVRERVVAPGRFELEHGPVERYVREVVTEPHADGRVEVRQHVEYVSPVRFFRWIMGRLIRSELRRIGPGGRVPWWASAERLDVDQARTLDVLAALAFVVGYLVALVPATFTYVADTFDVGVGGQGVTLAVLRADVLLTLPLLALADRRGRRWVLLLSIACGCALTAAGAAAPSLAAFAGTQLLARGFVNAAFVTIAVFATERMPAGARGWAIGLLVMAGSLGGGLAVGLLPLTSVGMSGWRLLYGVPLLGLLAVWRLSRRLPESARFEMHQIAAVPNVRAAVRQLRGHGRRLLLLGTGGFLLTAFTLPVSQFQNQMLREERGFGPGTIALFTIVTAVPGAIGVVFGGRLSDLRGRRRVLAAAAAGSALLLVAAVNSPLLGLWLLMVASTVLGGAIVPTAGAYGPELFPTSVRGVANGVLSAMNRAGSIVGLLLAGFLGATLGRLSFAFAVLAAGPLLLAVLVLLAYPETAGRSLEELNPEDATTDPLGAVGVSVRPDVVMNPISGRSGATFSP